MEFGGAPGLQRLRDSELMPVILVVRREGSRSGPCWRSRRKQNGPDGSAREGWLAVVQS